jgi:hypothetical protein
MSSDTKSTKPMPSVAEINAYLEQSAARTRMRLPLAKGAVVVPPKPAGAAPPAAPARTATSRALPLQSGSKLQGSSQLHGSEPKPAPSADAEPSAQPADPGAWRPFATDDES